MKPEKQNQTEGLKPSPAVQCSAADIEWRQGPILPVDIARDLWLALHKTRNSFAERPGLEKNEEALYQYLTHRFCCEAAIVGVECRSSPNDRTEQRRATDHE